MPRPPPASRRNRRGTNHTRPPHDRERLRISGLAAVRALFDCDPDRVERLFFTPAIAREVGALCRLLAFAHKPYREVDGAELARVAGTVLHGGIVAIARPRPLTELDPKEAREWSRDGKPLLLLDGVGNPHNLGAIARTAAFFGPRRLVLADRTDQAFPSDAAYRVAEGGLEHLALYRARLPTALSSLQPAYRILGTSLAGGSVPVGGAATGPVALILGNEETGLDPATLAACNGVVRIPGSGRVQSLNVASAAAILIYLLTRYPAE
jgi:RNA methyltransferase, TrmH family